MQRLAGSTDPYQSTHHHETWQINIHHHHPSPSQRSSAYSHHQSPSGWWFGGHFLHYIGLLIIIPIDEVIFFRGVALAHQPDQFPSGWCFGISHIFRPLEKIIIPCRARTGPIRARATFYEHDDLPIWPVTWRNLRGTFHS